MSVKRKCTEKIPTHKQVEKILEQLKTNPEVCEGCPISECTFSIYLHGKRA